MNRLYSDQVEIQKSKYSRYDRRNRLGAFISCKFYLMSLFMHKTPGAKLYNISSSQLLAKFRLGLKKSKYLRPKLF